MKKIAVIYHSGYGHTKKMAEHIALGAASVKDTEVSCVELKDGNEAIESLSDYDGMILGTPTYMGSASAVMKRFMENSSVFFADRAWKNKVAGGFTLSHSLSGDKLNTLNQLMIFAMQHGMIWVGFESLNASPDNQPGKADVVNRMGGFLGAMGQTENDSAEVTPPSGDLKTAWIYGERIATITHALKME